MSIIENNGKFKATLVVESTWAGNSVVGQLTKEMLDHLGKDAQEKLESSLQNTEVVVNFPMPLLRGMWTTAIIAVLKDLEDLRTSSDPRRWVESCQLIWVD